MKIVADRNIAQVAEAFAGWGEVITLPSSEITPTAVRDADVLLVRSTVKVGPELLELSRVKFVATATIGIDHLDISWLESRGIGWASAPGSNADSVALWWTAALFTVAARERFDPFSLRIGIVGVGNVGRRIERVAHALGRAPLRCDPPRKQAEGGDFVSLDALLAEADVVTVHVPLERAGEHATVQLLDAARLDRMREGALLINASRGEVIEEPALLERLKSGRLRAILDVFAGEPSPAPEVVRACTIATPHIAGHSADGKLNGTKMIYAAACRHFGRLERWSGGALGSAPEIVVPADADDRAQVLAAVRRVYHVEQDAQALAAIMAGPPDSHGSAFRRYREHYPVHRELHGCAIPREARPRTTAILGALGACLP